MNLIVDKPASGIESLSKMDTSRLKEKLLGLVKVTADTVVRMAQIVRILEDRGEDLAELRLSMIQHLRKVAHGQLAPEVLARFYGAPLLLNRLTALPIPDQMKLTNGDAVRVYELAEGGEPTYRSLDPIDLSREQIMQVFAADHIRGERDQLLYLRERRARQPFVAADPGVMIDQRRGGIVVKGTFIGKADLANYLARLTK